MIRLTRLPARSDRRVGSGDPSPANGGSRAGHEEESSGPRPEMNWERLAVWALAAILVAASAFIGYAGTPYTAPPDQLAAAESTAGVTITAGRPADGYTLAPSGTESTTALVFYPGGRVHPSAYVPVLAPVVARTQVTVFVPKPPFNLAVFDPGQAGPIIGSNPDIDLWYVGGHSLGGAMACRFADQRADRLAGLVLIGSYCDRDISDTPLSVLTIRGTRDTVLNREAYARNLDHLPEQTTTEVVVSGMNHTQAGAYHGQPGDSSATISDERAHAELRAALAEFLTGDTTQ